MYKYIVYETTNLVNNKIYIGLHKTVNPDVFDGYVGCGIYITQPYTYMHPKTAFQYAVKKYGPKNFVRKTLKVFDTLEEASDLEAQLVNEDFLSRNDVYNMVLGGLSGAMQYKIKVFQYDLDGNFIKEYESIADAAISMNCDHSAIGHAVHYKIKIKNYYWNQDKMDKLDLSQYNQGDNHQVPIYVYDLDGNYINEYNNQTIAAKELNTSISTLQECRLFGNILKKKYYICQIKAESFSKARTEYVKNRPVYKYNGDTGDFIGEYETQSIAEFKNINSNISKSIKLKIKCHNNFYWSVIKLKNYNKPINTKRKVAKYDINLNLICIYNSATAAANENGTSVWKVLNGTNKTHKNHIYKYLE